MLRVAIGVLVLCLASCTRQDDTAPSTEDPSSQATSTQEPAVPWTGAFPPGQMGRREFWLITTDIRQLPPTSNAASSMVIEADCVDNHLRLRESFRRYLPDDTRYLDYAAECTYQSSDLSQLETIRFSVVQSDGVTAMDQSATVSGEKILVKTGQDQDAEQQPEEIPWANDASVDLAMYFLITTLPQEVGRTWKVPHFVKLGKSLELQPHVVECLGVDEKSGEPGNPWTQFAIYPRGQEDTSVRFFVSADGVLQTVQLDPFRRLVLKQQGKPQPQPFQPEARKRLAEMAQAYRPLPACSVSGEYQIGSRVKGVWQEQRQPFSFEFVRPNRLHVNDGRLEMTYDGSQILECDHVTRDYTLREAKAPEATMSELVPANTKSAELFNSPTGFPLFVLWDLLTSDNAADALQTGAQGLWLEPDRTIDGRRAHAVVGDWPEGCDNRILIDAETKRILRIELLQDPIQARQMSGKSELPEETRLWWIPQQVLAEPPGDAFAISTPAGYTALQPPAPPAPRRSFVDELYNAPAALRGQPMPDFEITVLEANRQTRTLTKADLADRVTVMMLWDSTLPAEMPDLAELEHIVTASESLHGPLLFLAISQDREPEDLSELRDKVEEAVEEKGVSLDNHENVLLALDPDWNLLRALHLADPRAQVTPLLLIVDRHGTIQHIQVGISGEETPPEDLMNLLRALCEQNP